MEQIRTHRSVSFAIYRLFIAFYPSAYLERHRAEVLQNFIDVERDSSSALALWAFLGRDLITSLIAQHMRIKSSRAPIFAFLLFVPFLLMVGITIIHNGLLGAVAWGGPRGGFRC